MGTAVDKRKEALPSTDVLNQMAGDAGAGMEDYTGDDFAIPFIKLIQSMSPERQKSKPEYIEGAEEGLFFNSVTRELLGESFRAIPVAYQKTFNEWVPRDQGGGFVATHETEADALENAEPGNQIVETANHFVLVENPETGTWSQAILSMTSTKLKTSRAWNSMISMRKLEHPETGEKFTPPAYAAVYVLSAVAQSNDKGDFFNVKVEPTGEWTPEVDPSLYTQAQEFRSLIKEGELGADFSKVQEEEDVDDEVF